MTRKQDLEAVRDKVAAGDEPTATNVMDAFQIVGGIGVYALQVLPAYNGSLDAAKALHDAVLPGWHINVAWDFVHVFPQGNDGNDNAHTGDNDITARAWLLAILAGLIAQEAAQAAEGVE